MMLLSFGARERTFSQYSDLLARAGFVDVRLVPGRSRQLVVASRS